MSRPHLLIALFWLFFFPTSHLSALESADSAEVASFSIAAPSFVIDGIPFELTITALRKDGSVAANYSGSPLVENIFVLDGKQVSPIAARFSSGILKISNAVVQYTGTKEIFVREGSISAAHSLRSIPGILSIMPPIVAIALALIIRQVVVSLFAGIWLGAVFVFDYDPFSATLRVLDHFVAQALVDPDHIAIILFSMLFGGMVGIISRNGGTYGIADQIVRFARSRKRGQFGAWLLGIIIFFDDYANTLIVGNTMRPITDKLHVSREKLAYIVDSTAAPVSSLFFISTWIGYEVGLIDVAIKSIDYHVENAYWIFIDTIPFRFYPILTLVLGFAIAVSGRDFGPMLRAERRARREGKLFRDGAQLAADLTESSSVLPRDETPRRWFNGALPILTVIIVGIVSLYTTGYDKVLLSGSQDLSLGNIIGSSDSYRSLLWAALISTIVAIVITIGQRILSIVETMEAWFKGVKSMLLAMVILTLAWSIGAITKELHTAEYMVQILRGNLAVQFLPVLTFLISAGVSFATGTSWGTMGIIMPIIIPLTAALSAESGLDVSQTHHMLLGSVSSVLAGSVFGDHCSPISDTTIMSSMASGCDHVDHVRTQLPYAILVAAVGMILGDIPTAFGFSPYISILIGAGVLVGVLYTFGKKVET